MICDNNGVDVWELIKLANRHPRVDILLPGTGVGGHCIAVDPWFIVSADSQNTKLIKQARQVNDAKPNWVADKIIERAKKTGKDTPKIACLGLAFKPDIDDLRESPAIEVVEALLASCASVLCVEPNITDHPYFLISSFEDALRDADVIAILVGHKEFRSQVNRDLLRNAEAMDFCGVMA